MRNEMRYATNATKTIHCEFNYVAVPNGLHYHFCFHFQCLFFFDFVFVNNVVFPTLAIVDFDRLSIERNHISRTHSRPHITLIVTNMGISFLVHTHRMVHIFRCVSHVPWWSSIRLDAVAVTWFMIVPPFYGTVSVVDILPRASRSAWKTTLTTTQHTIRSSAPSTFIRFLEYHLFFRMK